MKNSKKLILVFVSSITFLLSACNKDGEPQPVATETVVESPLTGFLEQTGFNEETSVTSGSPSTYEFGYSFIPQVNGSIDSIKVHVPANLTDFRVSLWHKDSGIAIGTYTFDYVWIDAPVILAIDSKELTKGTEYMITMSSNSWFRHQKTDKSDVVYPFIVDNMEITGYYINEGTEPFMPTTAGLNRYSGDLDFFFSYTK